MLTPLLLALGLSGAALALDPTYAAYDALLQANVSPQGVTYAAIGPAGLDPFLAELAAVDLRELNSIEQKALYINAYNALTLDLLRPARPRPPSRLHPHPRAHAQGPGPTRRRGPVHPP